MRVFRGCRYFLCFVFFFIIACAGNSNQVRQGILSNHLHSAKIMGDKLIKKSHDFEGYQPILSWVETYISYRKLREYLLLNQDAFDSLEVQTLRYNNSGHLYAVMESLSVKRALDEIDMSLHHMVDFIINSYPELQVQNPNKCNLRLGMKLFVSKNLTMNNVRDELMKLPSGIFKHLKLNSFDASNWPKAEEGYTKSYYSDLYESLEDGVYFFSYSEDVTVSDFNYNLAGQQIFLREKLRFSNQKFFHDNSYELTFPVKEFNSRFDIVQNNEDKKIDHFGNVFNRLLVFQNNLEVSLYFDERQKLSKVLCYIPVGYENVIQDYVTECIQYGLGLYPQKNNFLESLRPLNHREAGGFAFFDDNKKRLLDEKFNQVVKCYE